jgi:hypothetical protein
MMMMAQEPYGIIQTVRKSMKSHQALLWHLALFCTRRKRIVQYCMDGARFDLQVMAFHCL